nr:Reticuline oxidase-like protein [Ipomoea batatas]
MKKGRRRTRSTARSSQIRDLHSFMKPFVSSNPRQAFLNYRDIDVGINHHGVHSYEEGKVYGERNISWGILRGWWQGGGSVTGRRSSITETSVTFAGDFSGRQSHCRPERSMRNPFELVGFPVYLNRRPNYSSSPNSRIPYVSNSSLGLAAVDSSLSNTSASLFTFSLVVRPSRPPNPSSEKWLQPPATTAAILYFHASKTLWVVSDKKTEFSGRFCEALT